MSRQRQRNRISPPAWAAIGLIVAALLTAVIGPVIVEAFKKTSASPSPIPDSPPPTATLPPFSFCQDKGMGGVETVPVNPPRSVKGIIVDLKTRHAFKIGQKYEKYGFSLWEVALYGPDTASNLAIGATASASSVQPTSPDCKDCWASKAIDGNNNTRWGSEFYESQWLQIDFSTPQLIRSITLKWQDAYAEAYCITEIK